MKLLIPVGNILGMGQKEVEMIMVEGGGSTRAAVAVTQKTRSHSLRTPVLRLEDVAIKIEGMPLVSPMTARSRTHSGDSMPRKTYNTNNGVVAFVTEDDELWVAPQCARVLAALDAAGFRMDKGMWVPMSNGELLDDLSLRRRWRVIQQLASFLVPSEDLGRLVG